jgi:hypothetical protein
LFTPKGLKAKEIEMELTRVHDEEALQIFVAKKRGSRFLHGRTELRDVSRSGRPANSDLTRVIAEFIREHPFLSCKILYRQLRVSKEICLRILHEKLAIRKFYL